MVKMESMLIILVTINESIFHFYECGEHVVSLTVTDSLGCDSTFTDTVIVYELPHPNFSTNAVCQGNPTCVDDLSDFDTTSNCFGHTISTWEWKIFDLNDSLVYSNLDSSSIDFCDTLNPDWSTTFLLITMLC